MVYRNWTITTYSTFLGYLVQYTSPFGQSHHTSPNFPNDEDALVYARAQIDLLMECERLQLERAKGAPAACP